MIIKTFQKDSTFIKFCWFGHCTIHINKKIGSKLLMFTKSSKISKIDHCSYRIQHRFVDFRLKMQALETEKAQLTVQVAAMTQEFT